MIEDTQVCKGEVRGVIEYDDGRTEVLEFKNAILRTGSSALASSLANEVSDSFDFFISRMVFGDGGTQSGVPKTVSTERNGLFGSARVVKPVISNIDPTNSRRAIFTSVISRDEGNGFTLNEMGLQMNNGDFYSMATFGGVSKSSIMQITWTWSLTFI